MEDASTDTLRKLAPSWTLAGDERLLTILQNTHQKLIAKCQEANTQLEKMASVLNDASISLQNVNNQFMALSSSQFVESRVYDDDELADIPETKEPLKPEIQDELESLKCSITVLDSAHEVMTILRDSDTESDTDDDMPHRLVLKPKDMYADRPLPYIIGSQPWKNKWHAGLLQEDSDTDSSASKVDSDQYSQSEPEDLTTDKMQASDHHDTTISETSLELPSEQSSVPKPTQADVANQIARRLGARELPKIEPEPEYEEPKKSTGKIYRPQDPVPTTIFSDEPPPLSEVSDSESDIFAELHRSQPYGITTGADDLFDNTDTHGDIFNDNKNQPAAKPTSYDDGTIPQVFDKFKPNPSNISPQSHDTPPMNAEQTNTEDRNIKKPVGGISLFGNQGTESIGAAILKRNQRQSTDSDNKMEANEKENQNERNIFDDLFARSENKVVNIPKEKNMNQKVDESKKKNDTPQPDKTPKVDLFSDNIFDDFDDIFSNDIVKIPSKDTSKTKSIFEDNDDLFSEIAVSKPMKIEVASSSKSKLFDSDDDLFSDDLKIKNAVPKKVQTTVPDKHINEEVKTIGKAFENKKIDSVVKDTKSIFDEDDDDIFSDVKVSKPSVNKADSAKSKNIDKILEKPKVLDTEGEAESSIFTSPSLFDDDDDDDSELFVKSTENINKVNIVEHLNTSKVTKEGNTIDNKPNSPSSYKTLEQNVIKNNLNSIISEPDNNTKINDPEKVQAISDTALSKNVDININNNASKISGYIKPVVQSSTDTEDEFVQDFDDLPPKGKEITKINTVNINAPSKDVFEGIDNIFDKNSINDDIFTEEKPSHSKFKSNETIDKTEIEDTNNKQPSVVETNAFSDIVTEPPAFEKPKEPKKSKNVNALFDDDSDDESLFFKKNDVTTDEKPEDFKPPQDRLFDIFIDEPPEVGFGELGDDLDSDLFSSLPKPKLPQNIPQLHKDVFEENSNIKNDIISRNNDDDIFNVKPKKVIKPEFNKTIIDSTKLTNEGKSQTSQEIKDKVLQQDKNMKLMNDNESNISNKDIINRAPSKTLDIVSDDEDIFFTSTIKPNEQIPKAKNDLPKLMKQESGNATSDDELFKSPAKQKEINKDIIQKDSDIKSDDLFKVPKIKDVVPQPVEIPAPEKSEPKKVGKLKVGLNINVNALLPGASPKKIKNDQTDGQTVSSNQKSEPQSPENQTLDPTLVKSVSFDENPDSLVLDNTLSKERAKIQVKRRPSTRRARKEAVRKSAIDFGEDSTDNSNSIDDPPKFPTENPVNTDKIDKNSKLNQNPTQIDKEIVPKVFEKANDEIDMQSNSNTVKSKVVYILNDEDIFDTAPVTNYETPNSAGVQTENSIKNIHENTSISSLDNNLNKNVTKNYTENLFDDNNEDIFKKTAQNKSNIFESDSEDELFGVTKRKEEKIETTRVIDTKPSLFGDDDDDDELFGVKSKNTVESNPQPSRSTVRDSANTEPVFEDPLSMFGDDD